MVQFQVFSLPDCPFFSLSKSFNKTQTKIKPPSTTKNSNYRVSLKQNQEDIPIVTNQERESVLEEMRKIRSGHVYIRKRKSCKLCDVFVRGRENWRRAARMRVLYY
ncbi:hypothetical protein ACB098_11G149900 [Castanea mollissima]